MKIFEFISKSRMIFNKIPINSAITFIIGNQSADLDSIVSSISLAYYKNLKLNDINYLPVLNTTLAILETKDECKYLLDYHQINIKDLIFLNEITFNNELKYSNSKMFLVDHNKLDDNEANLKFEKYICGVIDHHKDENLFLDDAKTRLIDNTIASNAFLIAEIIKNEINFDFNEPSLASLLLFAVLADTNNMSPERPRITDRDEILFDYLLDNAKSSRVEATAVYDKINELKVNSSNNKTIVEILQNDYKQWTFDNKVRYGMASVLINPKIWIEKESQIKWLDEIYKYIDKNSLNCFFILALYNDDENKLIRDLFVFGCLCEAFLTYPGNFGEVELVEKFYVNENKCGLWLKTCDPKKTRKIWQPKIEEFLAWYGNEKSFLS
jgi:exopolyphosphatase